MLCPLLFPSIFLNTENFQKLWTQVPFVLFILHSVLHTGVNTPKSFLSIIGSCYYCFSIISVLRRPETYHHARGHRNPPATVGVRNNVAVSDAEEGDGYQPHGVQQVGVLLVVVPGQLVRQSVLFRAIQDTPPPR